MVLGFFFQQEESGGTVKDTPSFFWRLTIMYLGHLGIDLARGEEIWSYKLKNRYKQLQEHNDDPHINIYESHY